VAAALSVPEFRRAKEAIVWLPHPRARLQRVNLAAFRSPHASSPGVFRDRGTKSKWLVGAAIGGADLIATEGNKRVLGLDPVD
jgi:hypothetical protein